MGVLNWFVMICNYPAQLGLWCQVVTVDWPVATEHIYLPKIVESVLYYYFELFEHFQNSSLGFLVIRLSIPSLHCVKMWTICLFDLVKKLRGRYFWKLVLNVGTKLLTINVSITWKTVNCVFFYVFLVVRIPCWMSNG